MTVIKKDLSIDNVKLIYEFNKTSPLFTRVANYEIGQGNYLYAIEILEKGIETYPDYATAYFIYALAKAYSGEEQQARKAAGTGAKLISSKQSLKFYNKKIDEIISERNSIMTVNRTGFLGKDQDHTDENKFFNIEDRLEDLAEKLSKAKIKVNYDEVDDTEMTVPEFKGKTIVSETLAGIYLSQKEYEKAVSIYSELVKLFPEKEEYYSKKIVEIKALMK